MTILPSLAVAAIAVAAAWLSFGIGFETVNLSELSAANIGQRFLTIAFVALFIERAVEIVVNSSHGAEEAELTKDVAAARLAKNSCAQALELAQKSGADIGASQVAFDAATQTHREKVAAANSALQPLRGKKAFTATAASVLISAFAAIIGFRIFGQFISGDIAVAIPNEVQRNWFAALDILITTLVLAGGADGVHNTAGQFLKRQGELSNPS